MTSSENLPDSQKLMGDNYQTWKVRCKLLLMKENTWKYTDPASNNRPVQGEPKDVAQRRARALFSITMLCREDIFNTLADVTDPRIAWNTLKNKFKKVNNASRLMLLDKVNSVRLPDGGSMQEYLKKLQEIKMHLKGVGHTISKAISWNKWWELYPVHMRVYTTRSVV